MWEWIALWQAAPAACPRKKKEAVAVCFCLDMDDRKRLAVAAGVGGWMRHSWLVGLLYLYLVQILGSH